MTKSTPPRFALRLLLKLAVADLLFDKKVSFCTIASIIAVIAPLLLLFSLKYGVVGQLQQQLLSDPQNLEVKLVGNLDLSDATFSWLAAQPEVQFVIPLTRSLNTQADLMSQANRFVSGVEILPTAAEDPLMSGLPQLSANNQIILSALAAEKLQVQVGSSIKLVITRQLAGQIEKGLSELMVAGIMPESRFSRAAGFVQLDLLLAMEDYYDGYQIAQLGGQTGATERPARTAFARARLYATGLEQVAPLALKLREKNIETRTQAAAIEHVQAINRVLNFIFAVIAVTSILGCILSLFGAFLANIERKRRDIALLRLLGFNAYAVLLYLIFQSLLLSFMAFLLSCLLYLAGSFAFNAVLGNNLAGQALVSYLHSYHILIAFLLTVGLSGLVVVIGGKRAIAIQPAESLREA